MKKRLVDADKLMERAKMNSVLVTVEHDHHDYGMTLGALNKIVEECELPPVQPEKRTDKRTETHACDCISRQEAIDALDVLCQEHRYRIPGKRETYSQYNEAWQDVLDRAEGAIFNLPPAQPEQQWILCSERLPEYGVAVLTYDGYCFCVEKRIPTIRDNEGEPITGDWWVSDDYDEYDGDYYPNLRDGACIAWMPLPTPYREE